VPPADGSGPERREDDRPIRVVVCDDHTILREGVRVLLESQPDMVVVGEASDGEEAVTVVDQLRPDVVLMDIAMPRVDGLEATRRIRDRHPDIRVLILSMHEDEEYVFPILEAGAGGYVPKKTASTDLVNAIRTVARGESFLYPSVAKKVVEEYLRRKERPAPDPYDGLTPREIEVLTLIAEGLTNQEIADRLFVSVKTVQAHRSNILQKLGVHDRVDLVKYAIRKGLIRLDKG